MNYTVAEAERILAEAKAREGAENEDPLTKYDKVVAESYRMAGHRTGHGPGKVAPHRERLAQVQKVAEARRVLEEALAPAQPATAPHLAAMEAAAEALAPFAKLGDMANFAFAPALFADSESLKELPWSEDGKPVTATFGDVRKATKALTQLTAALEAARKGD